MWDFVGCAMPFRSMRVKILLSAKLSSASATKLPVTGSKSERDLPPDIDAYDEDPQKIKAALTNQGLS